MNLWVVIDVGCHECGVPSEAVGIFRTEEEAKAAEEARETLTEGWREGGQTIAQIFEVELP